MEDQLYKPGERIANYEVLELLGAGGFSAVYKAKDLKDSPKAGPSAVKISRADFRTVPRELRTELNARMWREQEALARLDHPNIVRALEWGLHDGKVWYAMELLKGPTLGRYLAEERRPLLDVMLLYRQLLEAVAHCHENGVVHRDIKPSNIIVTHETGPVVRRDEDDRSGVDKRTPSERLHARTPVLFDFGTGHALGATAVTPPGGLVGTVEYLPPWYVEEVLAGLSGTRPVKQYKAEPVDDVYQLGVLLYAILTGRLPTQTPGSALMPLLQEICEVTPAHPRDVNPQAPEALSALAMRCLEKQSTRMPPDAPALRAAWLAAMNEDGEALRRRTPDFSAGRETTIAETREAVAKVVPKAPVRQTATETVSAPVEVLAEANALASSAQGASTVDAPTPLPAPPAMQESQEMARRLTRLTRITQAALVALALATLWSVASNLRAERQVQRQEEHNEHLAEQQQKTTEALSEVARALKQHVSQREPSASPLAATPPLPPPLNHAVQGGLKMPDKPEPNWLRPDKDGVCRNPKTGEKLRSQAVIRGSCWQVLASYPGEQSCPDGYYDPPLELAKDPKLKYLRDACFLPWGFDKNQAIQR